MGLPLGPTLTNAFVVYLLFNWLITTGSMLMKSLFCLSRQNI